MNIESVYNDNSTRYVSQHFISLDETVIESVTVYKSRATIHRSFSIRNLNHVGKVRVLVYAPNRFQKQLILETLRLNAYEINGAVLDQYTCDSVQDLHTNEIERNEFLRTSRKALEDKFKNSEEQELTAQIEELEKKKDELSLEQKTLIDSQQLLKQSFNRSNGSSKKSDVDLLSTDSLNHLVQFLANTSGHLAEYDGRISRIEQELASIRSKQSILYNKRNPLLEMRNKKVHEEMDKLFNGIHIGLIIDVESASNEGMFHLQYQVANSSWFPSYDVRVEDNNISINYYAFITQTTGEDWNNLESLYLTTVDPQLGYGPDPLPSKILTLPSSVRRGLFTFGSFLRRGDVSLSLFSSSDRQANANAIKFLFKVESIATVPSDDGQHKVLLSHLSLTDFARSHVTVPRLAPDAYLRIRTKNVSDIPLVAGKMNMFDGNNYIGTNQLALSVNPGEDFEFFIGKDPAVNVQYSPVKRKYSKKDYLAFGLNVYKKCLVERKITISNSRKQTILIDVSDQIPFSTDNHLAVTVHTPSKLKKIDDLPDKSVLNSHNNVMFINNKNNIEWLRYEVQSGKSATLTLKYTVEWPAKEILSHHDF